MTKRDDGTETAEPAEPAGADRAIIDGLVPDVVVTERERLYPQGVLQAVRGYEDKPQFPAALADQPEFVRSAAERQALDDAWERIVEEASEISARNRVAREAHAEAQTAAMLSAAPQPAPPQLEAEILVTDQLKWMFERRHKALSAMEIHLLIEHADRFKAAIRSAAGPAEVRLQKAQKELSRAMSAVAPYEDASKTLGRLREGIVVDPQSNRPVPDQHAAQMNRALGGRDVAHPDSKQDYLDRTAKPSRDEDLAKLEAEADEAEARRARPGRR